MEQWVRASASNLFDQSSIFSLPEMFCQSKIVHVSYSPFDPVTVWVSSCGSYSPFSVEDVRRLPNYFPLLSSSNRITLNQLISPCVWFRCSLRFISTPWINWTGSAMEKPAKTNNQKSDNIKGKNNGESSRCRMRKLKHTKSLCGKTFLVVKKLNFGRKVY